MKQIRNKNTGGKRSYIKPALHKHGLLSKLTLKTGSNADSGMPSYEP